MRLVLKLHFRTRVNCNLRLLTSFHSVVQYNSFILIQERRERNISINVYTRTRIARYSAIDFARYFKISERGCNSFGGRSRKERRADCTRETIYLSKADRSVVLDQLERGENFINSFVCQIQQWEKKGDSSKSGFIEGWETNEIGRNPAVK